MTTVIVPGHIGLEGHIDFHSAGIRNTFEAVPDAPVTSFRLELFGGKRGLIEMSSGFCAHPNAVVRMNGQNGKVHDTEPVVAASGCRTRKKGGQG